MKLTKMLTAGAVALLLTACGGGDADTAAAPPPSESGGVPPVGSGDLPGETPPAAVEAEEEDETGPTEYVFENYEAWVDVRVDSWEEPCSLMTDKWRAALAPGEPVEFYLSNDGEFLARGFVDTVRDRDTYCRAEISFDGPDAVKMPHIPVRSFDQDTMLVLRFKGIDKDFRSDSGAPVQCSHMTSPCLVSIHEEDF